MVKSYDKDAVFPCVLNRLAIFSYNISCLLTFKQLHSLLGWKMLGRSGGIMRKWHVRTEKMRDERTGKWEVKFIAVAPNGQEFWHATYEEAQQLCKKAERKA
jgi:hypothetical protein